MALKRNKNNKNPNRRPMRIGDMSFPISKHNKRVLEILEEREKKKKIL